MIALPPGPLTFGDGGGQSKESVDAGGQPVPVDSNVLAGAEVHNRKQKCQKAAVPARETTGIKIRPGDLLPG